VTFSLIEADQYTEMEQRQEKPTPLPPPIPDVYWVIPGRLLAGPYPGTRQAGAVYKRILRFLAAGITLFLDLTEEGEMPAYDQWLGEAARHVRTPIPDIGVPTLEQMAQTLDIIDVATAANTRNSGARVVTDFQYMRYNPAQTRLGDVRWFRIQ